MIFASLAQHIRNLTRLLSLGRIRYLLGISVLVLLSGSASGSEPSAEQIARAVEARYQSVRTLKATFLERYSESRNSVRVESGTVYFSRPGRMRWEYVAPEEKLFLVDGKNVWFYVPADRTVTRSKLKESTEWQTPLAMLVGKAKFSRVCGRIELVRPDVGALLAAPAAGPPPAYLLRCLPKSADAPFREALLEVDRAYRLTRVLIREPAGIETEFRFAGWQENLPLAEVMFHFQAPPGVAIVEHHLAGP